MNRTDAATTIAGGDGRALPRGRHGIPRDVVSANQRERLCSAASTLFAEQGYAALTVTDITDRAGISRATFYEIFDDKLACILAAYQAAFDRLDRLLLDFCAARRSWPEGVASAIAGALAFAADSPAQAQLLALAPTGALDPKLTKRALATNKYLLDLLRQGHQPNSTASEPLELAERAYLLGVIHVVGAELLAGNAARLPQMAPELAQIILTPYLGGVEASLCVTRMTTSNSQGYATT